MTDSVALTDDHFALLGLPRRQQIDRAILEANYRDVQQRVHPDRHAAGSPQDQRLAMQWATRANEAYQTLRSPLSRARYLIALAGHDIDAESNTAMPAAFLVEQMTLREAVEEANYSRDEAAVARLDALALQLRGELAEGYHRLVDLIDRYVDYVAAAGLVRQLMFQEKLRSEIDEALDALTT